MTRDELRELRARAIDPHAWPDKQFTLSRARLGERREKARAKAEATMKAEEDAGLAVVPLEATWRMAEVALRELYKDDPITLDEIGQGHPPSHRLKECHVAINDAIAKGNILKGDG